jgi:two-component system chemotaxis response regulator CheB
VSKIRVLIVDDSAVIRKMLTHIIDSQPDMQVVAAAPDPYVARDKMVELRPDVVTLDIEMPRMDGLTFLEKMMQFMPTRTIVISSLAQDQSETALRALEIGAIDVLEKPTVDVTKSMEALTNRICDKIRAVSRSRLMLPGSRPAIKKPVMASAALAKTTHQILAIASSTGGTEALKVLLAGLPADLPGTVIAQHMPAGFTKTYAENLNKRFPFEVKEAVDGDRVLPGKVLVAPGNYHMEIVRSGGYYNVKLHQEPLMHGVRPAADYLMKSVAKYAGANAVGVVLTGMGKDGAEGLLEMKKAGAYTIAQSERTCVVYGMPGSAVAAGAVDDILDLEDIAGSVLTRVVKNAA